MTRTTRPRRDDDDDDDEEWSATRTRTEDDEDEEHDVEDNDGEDEEKYPMLDRHLQAARAFIGPARRTGRVLVHCAAGLNRSGVLVAAERMLSTRETVLETVAHCRRARGNMVLCNESFQEQLVALARAHGRLGPAPTPPSPPGAVRAKPAARSALDRL